MYIRIIKIHYRYTGGERHHEKQIGHHAGALQRSQRTKQGADAVDRQAYAAGSAVLSIGRIV